MAYSKDIYESALKIIENRRQKSENDLITKKNLLFKNNRELESLDNSINKTGVKLARAVINGSDVKEQVELIKERTKANRKRIEEILSNMGLPKDYLKIKYYCPICKDTGYKDGHMCECLKKLLREQAFKKLNSLSPLSTSSFDDFNLKYYSEDVSVGYRVSPQKRMTDIYNYCRDYAENFNEFSQSILMQGNTGLGKTHLSLSIAGVLIERGFGVVYASTPNLVSQLEKEHFSYNKTDNNTYDYLTDCDLLILDDLGTEFVTNFSTTTIYNMLNSRILLGKPTIISTNLSIKEMEKIYSERFVSRIMGNNDRLEFIGKDLRQRIRKNNKKQ